MKIKREVRSVKESELPTVMEVLEREVQFGVVLQYPEKDIIFPGAKLSPVKSLRVNIISTESQDLAILHHLHSQTRTI